MKISLTAKAAAAFAVILDTPAQASCCSTTKESTAGHSVIHGIDTVVLPR